jgi:hypothetical protein
MAITKTAATKHRLEKLGIAKPTPPLCTIFVSPVLTALPLFVDERVAAWVVPFSCAGTKQTQHRSLAPALGRSFQTTSAKLWNFAPSQTQLMVWETIVHTNAGSLWTTPICLQQCAPGAAKFREAVP